MKHKLKKWHIVLMSFMALFVAVFASLFSLRADTVDEETGEILTDNWELSTVFYDSTVDAGTTPLTEINWDASDGGYGKGTPRVITVQINYKNTSAVTTYQPCELAISIPNIVYGSSKCSTQIIVGANDSSHTGYEWSFITDTVPAANFKTFTFTNANLIEEKSNFEGSIQIQYNITPAAETYTSIKKYEEMCIDSASTTVKAVLSKYKITTFTSENFPEITKKSFYIGPYISEYSNGIIECNVSTQSSMHDFAINTKKGTVINYYKFAKGGTTYLSPESDYFSAEVNRSSYSAGYSFLANIFEYFDIICESNTLNYNYTRTYIHPWKPITYTITKTASKITSYDGLGANASDYIWVKYNFAITRSASSDFYPDIHAENLNIQDVFPEQCIVLDKNMNAISHNNNIYAMNFTFPTVNGLSGSIYIFVGYPKSIYNEEANNLIITNYAELYGTYDNKTEEEKLDDSSVSINLNDFIFKYDGELYTIKKESYFSGRLYSDLLLKPNFSHTCGSCFKGHATTLTKWNYTASAIFTGTPMSVRFGDDILYISDENGNYRKLEDTEYFLQSIYLPYLYNGNNVAIPYDKYPANLYVRYAGNTDFVHYMDLSQKKANSSISFPKDSNIVGFYIEFSNLLESIKINSNTYGSINYEIKPLSNIAPSGKIYNFNYLQVFFENSEGTTLQNAALLENYNSLISKTEIAEYDMATYGTYLQRSTAAKTFSDYNSSISDMTTRISKDMSDFTQNIKDEKFEGLSNLFIYINGPSNLEYLSGDVDNYIQQVFLDYIDDINKIQRIEVYDLLPEGLELTSTKEQLLSTITVNNNIDFYDINGIKAFASSNEAIEFFKDHSTITIENNWNNTNRTKITWIIDITDSPLFYLKYGEVYFRLTYNYNVSYDSYLQYGATWTNYAYLTGKYSNGNNLSMNNKIYDKGQYDKQATDINENKDVSEYLSYAKASKTITSVISTHQDVTTYVKTDFSNYSTGTVNSSCNTEYEYKLRVRTGTADVTNLIIYSNLEEAQPERTRWKGEFLGIDTSYAESKGYLVKPYYSESSNARNLYDDNGNLKSEWKEFTPPKYTNGLAITFNENCATYHSSDYLYIYYNYDNKTYRSPSYSGTALAGKTIEIPATDFYIYWYSNGSGNNAYGFSIDKIEPCVTTNILGSSGYSLPTGTITEISGSNYPETLHNPYNNSETLRWHYSSEPLLLTNPTDTSLVKSLAFEYLDTEGNPAILPANSLTYVLINMKSPADESIKTLARMDCRTQWNALDEFDQPVDFITGINSNVVKVALPNSVDEDSVSSITLKFIKEIQGTETQFENMKLDIATQQTFMIRLTSLTENDDGTYNQVAALLKSDQELIISQIPVGTYLLEELGDNYFDFVDFTDNNDPEIIINGVTFERTNQGYIITVLEDLSETVEFNIKVTNKTEDERFYEEKHNKENLFLINKINNGMMDPDDPQGH